VGEGIVTALQEAGFGSTPLRRVVGADTFTPLAGAAFLVLAARRARIPAAASASAAASAGEGAEARVGMGFRFGEGEGYPPCYCPGLRCVSQPFG
ncbi:MAG: hypothetical protein ACLGIS_10090, partial [Actinomycetes bacterium]